MLSELWQNEKRRLTARLRDRVLLGRDAVLWREIVEMDLPEVFQILIGKRSQQMFEEAIRLSNPEFYDLNNPVVQDLIKPLQQVMMARTKISRDEVEKICVTAIALQVDIVVRPRAALFEILFNAANERDRDDVIVVAEGFGAERPFIQKLVATLRELHSPRIFGDLFDTLTRTTEQSILRDAPISALLTDFKLLLKLEAQVIGEACAAISSPLFLGMLVERELEALADDLGQESGKESLAIQPSWTLAEIESVLERHWLVGAGESQADSNSEARVVDSGETNGSSIEESLRSVFMEE